MFHPTHTFDREFVHLSSRTPVRVDEVDPQEPRGPHDHEFHEIAVVVRGSATHVTEGGRSALGTGDVLVLPPGCVHAYENCRSLALVNIYYLGEWFLTGSASFPNSTAILPLFFRTSPPATAAWLRPSPEEWARIRRELQDLRRAIRENRPRFYAEACFMKLLAEFASACLRENAGVDLRVLRPEIMRGVEHLERAVAARGSFRLAEAAAQAGLSPSHFSSRFHEEVGLSPRDYFQRHRIYSVCRRLLETSASVTELAQEFGYADVSHLNRYFRRYRGMAPLAYRRRYGGADPAS